MRAVRKNAIVCLAVAFAFAVEAVVEKTREDVEQRRHVFTRNRTETRRNVDKPSTSSVSNLDPVSTPLPTSFEAVQTRNRSRSTANGHFGSIQIGPGLNIQVSGGLNLDFGEDRRWWKGPNVCVRNETHEETAKHGRGSRQIDSHWRVMHHRLMVSHTCDDTGSAYKCTTVRGINGKVTTTVKIYECCAGYERQEDDYGCMKTIELTDLMLTLKRLNATSMIEAMKLSGLDKMTEQEDYTIFAPINNAFEKFKVEETNANVVKITPDLMNFANDMDSTIVSHMVKGFVRMTDVEDEQLIPTGLHSADIRINKYNVHWKKLMTANCVPMITKDVPATNGIVHVVQNMLPTVTENLDQLVNKNPELSQLHRVMRKLQLNDQGQYTLLAPTNAAFDKLKPNLKEKIFKGHRCGIEILKHHLLPNVICSAVVENRAVTTNVAGQYVSFKRVADKLSVEDAGIVQPDVMGTNGVMHVIDTVIIPDDAGDVLDAADRMGTSNFLQLIETAGLTEKLHNMNNFTMFLPTNDALKALPADILDSLSKNPDRLGQLINYHIVPQRIKYRALTNDDILPTLDDKSDILVKSYYSFPFSRSSVKTVQCAPIVQSDVNSCGDMVHVVSKVLLPPSGDVLSVLANNTNFTTLMSLVRTHRLEDIFRPRTTFTFFAPTNQAFESLPAEALNKLQNDSEKLTKILKSHMISDILCCAGVFKNAFRFASREVNMEGWIVGVENNGNKISFGHAPVVSCDQTATNGVVHSTDKFATAALSRYDIVQSSNPWRRFFGGAWNFDDVFDYSK